MEVPRSVSLKTIFGSSPMTIEFPFKSDTPSLYLGKGKIVKAVEKKSVVHSWPFVKHI